MGWNKLNINSNCPLFRGIGNEYVYFVHSYYVKPENTDIIAATVDYGIELTAAVCQDNVFATQFHPEKSGEIGLKILRNFISYIH